MFKGNRPSIVRRSDIQGVSKKRYFLDFLCYFSSRGRILLFHMCFGIKISNPFHLAIQKVSIQNLNCPKNACADMIFIPAQSSLRKAGIKIMSAHAFFGQYRVDTFLDLTKVFCSKKTSNFDTFQQSCSI